MGTRRRLFELVNSKLPSWASARLRYEGVVHVLDSELSGTLRFAQALGHPLPVWVPDTSTTLTSPAYISSEYIDVVPNSWFVEGARLRLAQRYDVYVSHVTGDGTRVHLKAPVGAHFDTDTEVTIWDVPVTVSGTWAGPTSQFVLHTQYPIYRGDVLVFDAFHEIEVSDAVAQVPMPDGTGVYLVTISEAYDLGLVEGQVLGLRAYPAYASPRLLAPTRQPFVFDRVSGAFYEDMVTPREVDTLMLHDDFGDVIETVNAHKNFVVARASIPVDSLMFGKRMEGTVRWDSAREAVTVTTDSRSRAYFRYPLAPSWPHDAVPFSWTITLEATGPAKVSVTMAPGPKVTKTIDETDVYTLTVPMPNVDVDEIQFRVFADPGVSVRIRSWTITTTAVRMVSHTTVAQVSGPWLWGSTGALGKRGLRLEDIILTTDLAGVLTAGYITG